MMHEHDVLGAEGTRDQIDIIRDSQKPPLHAAKTMTSIPLDIISTLSVSLKYPCLIILWIESQNRMFAC